VWDGHGLARVFRLAPGTCHDDHVVVVVVVGLLPLFYLLAYQVFALVPRWSPILPATSFANHAPPVPVAMVQDPRRVRGVLGVPELLMYRMPFRSGAQSGERGLLRAEEEERALHGQPGIP